MTNAKIVGLCSLVLTCCFPAWAAAPEPTALVNTLIGTGPFEDEQYLGNNPPKGEELYTGTVVPGAMAVDPVVKLSPDTGFDGIFHVRGSSYRHNDASIVGFSHLHHEYNRYANVLFMPTIGPVRTRPGSRESWGQGYRSVKDSLQERGEPGYYTVFLADYGIKVELTATKNAGFHRYTFPSSDQARVLIDLASAANANPVVESHADILNERTVAGWEKCKSFTVYFQAEFDPPFTSYGTWKDDTLHPGSTSETGRPVGVHLDFKTTNRNVVLAKVGISLVDAESAKRNLAQEIPGWDFDRVRKQATAGWNELLGRIEVEGGTGAERTNFYTSLYRAMASESFLTWPNGGALQTIVRRDWVAARLANAKWAVSRGGFWGPHQASWIAGAYARGLRDFDVAAAYEALRRSATDFKAGWERVADYRRLGYITTEAATKAGPVDSVPGRPDVVNRTLGYTYEDYCIAQIARALGRQDDYEYFMSQSGNYRLLFDPVTGFMRGRRPDGFWAAPFEPSDPFAQSFYREGTAWQYLWLVPHDIEGLIRLLGGREAFLRKLDEFFSTPYNPPQPMRDITGLIGQYAHGNETDRYVPYLYTYAGAPWKSQQIIRRIMRELHKPVPGGLCGMDDNGYLTGWYVFAALGFFPVEPASGNYVIGSPVFSKATLHLKEPDGSGQGEFVIEAHNASDDNIYIQSATLNGKPLERAYFHHSALFPGGRLVFEMAATPNKQWAANPEAAPPSVTGHTSPAEAMR
jgi:putative alpha-1,2-mannosidase